MSVPTDPNLSDRCEWCIFYFESEVDANLRKSTVCRRYPPIGQLIPSGQGAAQIAFFPAVQSIHWCGEFKRKDTLQ